MFAVLILISGILGLPTFGIIAWLFGFGTHTTFSFNHMYGVLCTRTGEMAYWSMGFLLLLSGLDSIESKYLLIPNHSTIIGRWVWLKDTSRFFCSVTYMGREHEGFAKHGLALDIAALVLSVLLFD